MLSNERQMEIYRKIAALGTVEKSRKLDVGVVQGEYMELKLDVTIPEALVGLGIVTTEKEAENFIVGSIASSLTAAAVGLQDGSQALHDLVKFGFFLGTLANRANKGGN